MRKTTCLTLCALFAVLTAAGAFIHIPTPVSAFTLQSFFAAMAGVLLGRRWGAASQAVYVLLGLTGLPVFTGGGGLQALMQPTGGFILALIPMAWVIGLLAERNGSDFRGICLACTAGLAVLYAIGLPWLHLVMTVLLHRNWSVTQTLVGGFLVFLPWDLVKLLLAAWLSPRLRRTLSLP